LNLDHQTLGGSDEAAENERGGKMNVLHDLVQGHEERARSSAIGEAQCQEQPGDETQKGNATAVEGERPVLG
jgi:hypothetical protein